MRPAGDPHLISSESTRPGWQVADSRLRVRVARAANDNQRTHTAWRRFVAAGMAALFAASLVLVGLICVARAAEVQQTSLSNP
jgi:hypothetical protein